MRIDFTGELMKRAEEQGVPFKSLALYLACESAADTDWLDSPPNSPLSRQFARESDMWARKASEEDTRRWLQHGIPSIDSRLQDLVDVIPALAWGGF